MSTSNNPDEIPADAKALEPDAGEEAKKVSSACCPDISTSFVDYGFGTQKEEAGMDTLPTIT